MQKQNQYTLYVFVALMLSVCIAVFTACGEVIEGPPGPKGAVGATGPQGSQGDTGAQGPKGDQGQAGSSCTVSSALGVSTITCQDGTSAYVYDGTNGADATQVSYIALCPNKTGGVFREYLLKIGSSLFGVYASGTNIGLTSLGAGNWVTTDGRSCAFTVTASGEVVQ